MDNTTTETYSERNRRIAINTLLLYVRSFVTMIISLFTSRVILESLGVDNFGTYNVVGGVVGLFSIISGTLVNAISRFLTYHLGRNDEAVLKKTFSSSVQIQILLSLLLIIVAETIGLWFVNHKLNISPDRMYAANWVYQISIITSVFGLMVVPYSASIVAHEKMGIYAYFSIIEVVVKLILVYILFVINADKLIVYAIMLMALSIMMQALNFIYCKLKFKECVVYLSVDRNTIRQMLGFSGWNFIGNFSNVLNGQGINILMNIFFGVAVNAARGVVSQVETSIRKFVDNFMTALNPQMIKSYAAGDTEYVRTLMDRSARFSYYLYFIMALPIGLEAGVILKLWLVEVPEYSVIFLRFTLIISAILLVANPSYTVLMATGQIKKMQLYSTISCVSVLPLTWVMYHFGMPAYVSYILLILYYSFILYIRMFLLKPFIGNDVPKTFMHDTIRPIIKITVLSTLIPMLIMFFMDNSILRLIILVPFCVINSSLIIYYKGMDESERKALCEKIKRVKSRFSNKYNGSTANN